MSLTFAPIVELILWFIILHISVEISYQYQLCLIEYLSITHDLMYFGPCKVVCVVTNSL